LEGLCAQGTLRLLTVSGFFKGRQCQMRVSPFLPVHAIFLVLLHFTQRPSRQLGPSEGPAQAHALEDDLRRMPWDSHRRAHFAVTGLPQQSWYQRLIPSPPAGDNVRKTRRAIIKH